MAALGSPVTFDRGVVLNKTVNNCTFDGGFDSLNGTSMNNTEGQGVTNGVVNCLNSTDAILSAYDLNLASVTLGDYGILSTRFGAGQGTVFGWFYYYHVAHPTVTTAIILRLRDASSTLLSLTVTTGGNLRLLNNAAALVGTNYALSAATLYRIGFQYTKGTGANSIHRMWVATDTADEDFGAVHAEATNGTATANVTTLRVGNNDASAVPNGRIAHLTLDDTAMPATVTLPVTKYVATTGNDSTGTGAIGAPWATITKAINTHQDDGGFDRIYVRAGTYQENIAFGTTGNAVRAGTSGKRVIFRNYPTETVWIRGGIRLATANYWTMRGINVEWDPALDGSGDPSHMVQIKHKAQYPEVVACHFRNAKAFAAMLISDNSHGWYHHLWIEDTIPTNSAYQDHLIYMTAGPGEGGANGYEGEQNSMIEYCLLTGCSNGRGVKIGAIAAADGDPHENTIRFCTFYGNYGPANVQLSFGAADNIVEDCIMQEPETTSDSVYGYSTGSFLLTGSGNIGRRIYAWECSTNIVKTGNAGLTGSSNTRVDPLLTADWFPGAASLLSSSKPIAGHLAGLTAASGWAFDVTTSPTTTSISPTSIEAGAAQFVLTVNGTNFEYDTIDGAYTAVVKWAGSALATTFVSSTQLTAVVPAALVASPGTASVTVTNPRGNNTSGGQTFTINSPPTDPFISELSPSTKVAGQAEFTLTVNGVNFDATCVVKFAGTNRATTFVSAAQLTAVIPAAAISSAGSKDVLVTKTDANDSNTVTFTVSAAAPILTSVSPNTKQAGAAEFTMTLTGTGFDATSTARFAGSDKTTVFGNSTSITATIPSSDLVTPGGYAITVNLPTGESNDVTFTVTEAPDPAPTTNRRRRHQGGPLKHRLVWW